ncbi:MAG: hypothetical protein WBQ14_05845 [Gaiellaceae bacterium]
MNAASLHPLARAYLKRLKRAARRLPRARRKELTLEIEAHLLEALPAGASETEALNALERLGEPEQILAEAESKGEAARAGAREWVAIPLLLLGGFVFALGWIAGALLLWSSRIWTLRDKLIGTLVVPGGLSALVLVVWINVFSIGHGSRTDPIVCVNEPNGEGFCGGGTSSHSGPYDLRSWALTLALITLPFFTSSYLAWRATTARRAPGV